MNSVITLGRRLASEIIRPQSTEILRYPDASRRRPVGWTELVIGLPARVARSPLGSWKRRYAERRDHFSDDLVWCGSRNHGVVVLCCQALPCVRASGPADASRSASRSRLAAVPLDTHIATESTDGRRRVDALLALTDALAASLELEVETLNRLDTSDPLYDAQHAIWSALPCVVSPSTNTYGMSAACWFSYWSSVGRISRNLRG
jgi:hypothetical protein